ncbi:MAG: hypothetical protein NWS01_12215, partial [Burkholderiales bacterium]|nr:hypothetical protein [Burkholderiales bacterium]
RLLQRLGLRAHRANLIIESPRVWGGSTLREVGAMSKKADRFAPEVRERVVQCLKRLRWQGLGPLRQGSCHCCIAIII